MSLFEMLPITLLWAEQDAQCNTWESPYSAPVIKKTTSFFPSDFESVFA